MQNNFKKIITILTIIVLVVGMFSGYRFYQNAKTITQTNGGGVSNTDRNRTPFQTRVSTSTDAETIAEEIIVENPTESVVKEKPKLVELWKEPVSGFDFIFKDMEILSTGTNNSTSTTNIVKNIQNKKILKNQEYVYLWDRKTGHIYENLASTTDTVKISNYTLPGAEEAYFVDNSSVVVRNLMEDNETISTK